MRYTIEKCWGNRASVREEENTMNEPLAQRLRPKTLADVCGQQHLLAPGRVFRRTIESGRIPNMIFYGPVRYRKNDGGTHHCRKQRYDAA